uniref:Uncharacterized protein LOC100370811 n=1 Tax=Saccoglossus kowalevskii TaxID=10224 RepID=A0ABM0MEH0_SACKO|nr:PREDICTED: uncharacterized protein LOC100370811 [Saccoglossus kowalevskii]
MACPLYALECYYCYSDSPDDACYANVTGTEMTCTGFTDPRCGVGHVVIGDEDDDQLELYFRGCVENDECGDILDCMPGLDVYGCSSCCNEDNCNDGACAVDYDCSGAGDLLSNTKLGVAILLLGLSYIM